MFIDVHVCCNFSVRYKLKPSKMCEIVGGLDINDVAKGGTEFTLKNSIFDQSENNSATEELNDDYFKTIEVHTLMECLEINDDGEGSPFDRLSLQMHNLIPDGQIKKRILREGYGSRPQDSNNVKIEYNAYIQFEAHPFDSTYTRKKPCRFTLGQGEVIEGLEIAVRSMKINEKAQFLIQPEYAYRQSGLNRIPPNSTVLFIVEMQEMIDCAPEDDAKTNPKDFAEVYKFCLALCVKGKYMFRLQNYSGAVKEYQLAVKKLQDTILNNYEEQLTSDELLVRLHTNLLVCFTQTAEPKRGCYNANQIFAIAKNGTFKVSAKVYFNNAKCLCMLGDFKLAMRRLKEAQILEPHNPEIQREFNTIKNAREIYMKKQAEFGRALLSS